MKEGSYKKENLIMLGHNYELSDLSNNWLDIIKKTNLNNKKIIINIINFI